MFTVIYCNLFSLVGLYSQPILGPRLASKAEQFFSMEEPREPRCDSMERLKLVLGSAHCEALLRFEKEETK